MQFSHDGGLSGMVARAESLNLDVNRGSCVGCSEKRPGVAVERNEDLGRFRCSVQAGIIARIN